MLITTCETVPPFKVIGVVGIVEFTAENISLFEKLVKGYIKDHEKELRSAGELAITGLRISRIPVSGLSGPQYSHYYGTLVMVAM